MIRTLKCFLAATLLLVTLSAKAQTIQGLTSVFVGDVKTYTFNTGSLLTHGKWSVNANGTVPPINPVNGTTYTANVTWTTAGTGTVIFQADGEIYATLTVTISTPCPLLGSPTSAGVSRCGTGIVNLSATAGTNGNTVKWYTSSTGGTLLNTGLMYSPNVTATATYYIASYNTSTGCESSSRVSITATVKTEPLLPIGSPSYGRCGSGTLHLSASIGPTATSLRWYDSPSAGNLLTVEDEGADFITPNLSSTTTYYVTSFNSTTGCESFTRKAVVATINTLPLAPTVSGNNNIGSGTLTLAAAGAPTGSTYKWYSVATGGTPVFSGNPYLTPSIPASVDNYIYTSAINQTCEGARTPVSITIIPIPVVSVSSFYVAKNELVTLTSTSGYDSYSWSGPKTGTGAVLSTNLPGSYTLTVTKNGLAYTLNPITIGTQFENLNSNYVTTNTFQSDITGVTIIDNLSVDNVGQTIQYFDGFGRPQQTVITQGSPLRKDVVQPVAYNDFGIENIKYLPYVSGENNGRYKNNALALVNSEQKLFYSSGTSDKISVDSKPFAETIFDGSPLKRVIKQGAPGSAWQPDATNTYASTDKTVKKSYGLNLASEVVQFKYLYPDATYPMGTLTISGFFSGKDLSKNSTKDEEGNEVIEFINKEGQTILKKVQSGAATYAQTYYVYDDFGNLVYVIQPEGVNAIVPTLPITWSTLIGASVGTNSVLTKTAATGYGNAGATSTVASQTLAAGVDGWVETIANEINKSRMIGLAATNVNAGTNIQYAMELRNDGKIYVWENGVAGACLGNYFNGTSLRISREGTQIKYYVDGVYRQASISSSTGTLLVDAALNETGATLQNVSISFNANTVLTSVLSNFAFKYTYDARHRMSQKQVPGAGSVYMVYDNRDRLVLTQDANQRNGTTGYWTFTKYDELNRPILTGIKDTTVTVTQVQMQSAVDTYYSAIATKPWRKYGESFKGSSTANTIQGYTNYSYPQTTSPGVLDVNSYLTATYYDNYTFRNDWPATYGYTTDGLTATVTTGTYTQPATGAENQNVIGLATGAKIKVLDGGVRGGYTWLRSITYYDDKYRVIQTQADNYKGGTDLVSNLYDFVGKVLTSKETHIEYDPTLTGVNNINLIGNKLISMSNAWGNSGAASIQTLAASQNGWVECTASETTTGRIFGLSDTNPDYGYVSIRYGYQLSPSGLYAIESNVQTQLTTSYNSGDILTLERNGSTIYYKRNGAILRTVTNALTSALFIDIAMNHLNGTLVRLRSSFSTSSHSITRTFDYDHEGRLLRTWHKVDNGTNYILSKNEYNELGQLIDKKLHSTLADGSNNKQSVDYRYNIRGWLTSMNNSQLTNDAVTNDDTGDYFGMNLRYEQADANLGSTGLYNGNISGMRWSTNLGLSDIKETGYNFTYDAMNRLTAANSKMNKTNAWQAGYYDENGLTYDLNGNIKTLLRKGDGNLQIDNLTYGYYSSGNQLQYVKDNTVSTTDKLKGFIDGNSASGTDGPGTAVDYTYDANGNLTHDLNKGTGSTTADAANIITYNYLNLPETVTKAGNTVRYIYDASGRKLSQVVTFINTTKQTDYVGEFQYENDVLQFINHEEGRIMMSKNNLLYTNSFDAVTSDITTANLSVALAAYTSNGEKYVKATSNGTAGGGLTQIGKIYTVAAGERYRVRVKGYRGTSAAYLQVTAGSTVLNSPGTALPNSVTTESWVEQIVTIPAATTTMKVGVVWKTTANGQILYVNEIEISQLTTQAPEYQYNLKDHLGNVRVTFTSTPETVSDLATMEVANRTSESGKFLRYDKVRIVNSNALFDHTNGAAAGSSIRLSGNANEKTGLVKSLAVMPGDVIDMEVWAKYVDSNTTNWTGALTTALMNAIAAGTGGTVTDGATYSSNSTTPYPYMGLNNTGGSSGTGPKAYLNYIMFDKDFNPILTDLSQTNYVRLSSTPKEYGQDVAHEKMSASVTVKQPGYMYIYLSNEEATPVEVYFDDMKVTQTKSPIIASNDYYPFGLTFNSYSRENSVRQDFLYNGKEMQDELNLGWLEYGARMYINEIGRWAKIDLLADKYEGISPYAYALNDPSNAVDPDGNLIIFVNGYVRSQDSGHDNRQMVPDKNHNGSYPNHNYRPYPGERTFEKRAPTYLGERFSYWGNELVVGEPYSPNGGLGGTFSKIYNDYNTLFISASAVNNSQAQDRFDEGVLAADDLIKKLESGQVKLGDNETIKIIGHSQGAAFAAGMVSVLAKHAKYSSRLEVVHYVSPHQPADFEHMASVAGFQWSTKTDLVSSDQGSLLMLFNGGSSYKQIKGIKDENFIQREEGGYNGQLGGHTAKSWIIDVLNWAWDNGILATVGK